MRYPTHEMRGFLQAARNVAAFQARQDAVSEILAAAIVCDDDTAAEVMTGLAEHLARGFSDYTMDNVKARAVEIAYAAPTEGDNR